MRTSRIYIALSVLVLLCSLLVGCGSTPAPSAVPTQAAQPATAAPAVAATKAPPTATTIPATPTVAGPTVGGTLVWAVAYSPDTLDPQKSARSIGNELTGSSLVALDANGQYVPYLADSWTTSADGLTWTFTLKKGVKFQDGSSFTAKDYVWTFQRALSPDTKSPVTASLLAPVAKAEAPDDYTLRLTLQAPFFPILYSLSLSAYTQPLSQAAVEKAGDQYGQHPVGVGPYRLKQWVTGDRLVFERNPDFNWNPAYAQHKGPHYIQNLEIRIIPEAATVLAGLQAGEIDYATISPKDADAVKNAGHHQILTALLAGAAPLLAPNLTKAPFGDLNVRKALSMAIDRDALVKVVALGQGQVQYGPLSASVIGYWPDVEKLGYGLDVAKAKALLTLAGYKLNASGIQEKDGKPFQFTLLTIITYPEFVKVAEMLKEQWKAIGVNIDIRTSELGAAIGDLVTGNFDMALADVTYAEADLLSILYDSSQVGTGLNVFQLKDPALDKILAQTRSETDPTKRQEACNAAQKMITENLYSINLYAPKSVFALSSRIKGAVWTQGTGGILYLDDAYVAAK